MDADSSARADDEQVRCDNDRVDDEEDKEEHHHCDDGREYNSEGLGDLSSSLHRYRIV